MANELVTGTVIVNIDGQSIRSMADASIMLGGFERKSRVADGRTIGFSETPIASKISCKLIHTSLSDLDKINNLRDGTITFVTDTGVVYTVANAFCTKPPELKGGDSEVTVEFEGQPATRTS
jgi:membrane-associated protease RseP (regulator of RpoE activity)